MMSYMLKEAEFSITGLPSKTEFRQHIFRYSKKAEVTKALSTFMASLQKLPCFYVLSLDNAPLILYNIIQRAGVAE